MQRGIDKLERMLSDDPIGSWGQRMRFYRNMAELTMEEAAGYIDEFTTTGFMTLARLEKRDTAPTDRRQRRVALFALIVYGIHPKVMGLSLDELPSVDLGRLLRVRLELSRERNKKSRWTHDSDSADVSVGAA